VHLRKERGVMGVAVLERAAEYECPRCREEIAPPD
jgi:predicted RNA-binding Zn-ribbon protein involved in translation (DUF1610 family)